jgi:putative transcriptional regulator
MTDMPELTDKDFARAMKRSQRQLVIRGALGISVHTLRNWEQGRRYPEGPALALLRIAARYPKIIRESAAAVA